MVYAIFALTTAIMASLFLLNPTFKLLRVKQPLNPIVQYSWITQIVFFCMSLLFAPIMFLSVIVPSMGDRFKIALEQSLIS